MDTQTVEERTVHAWTKRYLELTLEDGVPVQQALKRCAGTHFEALGLEELLSGYRGSPERFFRFLEAQWGWKITYEPERGRITADEQKAFCVCPLVKAGLVNSGELCRCSEGFAETMFSFVLERPVRARVLRSFLRDGQSCIYEIEIPGAP